MVHKPASSFGRGKVSAKGSGRQAEVGRARGPSPSTSSGRPSISLSAAACQRVGGMRGLIGWAEAAAAPGLQGLRARKLV